MNYQYHLELHLLYIFIGAVIIAISLYGFGIYSKLNPIVYGWLTVFALGHSILIYSVGTILYFYHH